MRSCEVSQSPTTINELRFASVTVSEKVLEMNRIITLESALFIQGWGAYAGSNRHAAAHSHSGVQAKSRG